jgi:hypothetical protein
MNLQELLQKHTSETDRLLIESLRSNVSTSPEGEQARMLIQIRMIDRLVNSLDKNSASSDKLANRLNWLTFVIASATCIGAFTAIIQLTK